MTLILPRGSSFGFTAGRAPGFDPSHAAAQGMNTGGFSVVSTGSNFVNLLNGALFAKISTSFPTAAIQAAIGPGGLIDSTSKPVNISGQATPVISSVTYGAIVKFTGTGDGSFCAVIGLGGSASQQFGMNGTSKQIYNFFNGADVSSFTLTLNVPYFIATSLRVSVLANYVATNLLTGQIFSSTHTPSGLSGTAASNPTIGVDWGTTGTNGTHYANAYIAAAMWSPQLTPLSELVAWAGDPWAFWYPRRFAPSRDLELVGKAAAAFKAAWALNRNFINEGIAA